MTVTLSLPASRYDSDDRIRAFTNTLLDEVRQLPGIRAVGAADYLPMSGVGNGAAFEIEGRPVTGGERRGAWVSKIGGDYFATMGIPVVRGRAPTDDDSISGRPVFVVDEGLARLYWRDQSPIGERLTFGLPDGGILTGEIVGVVGSVKWQGVGAPAPATVYWWLPQAPSRAMSLVVRSDRDPTALSGAIAASIRRIDPNQAIGQTRRMSDLVTDDLARVRAMLVMFATFASAALCLAALGINGVIALAVSRRTREIGVRVALGAQRRDVVRLVLKRGARLTTCGLAAGIVLSLALGRIFSASLYGVTSRDLSTLLATAALVTAIAMFATYLPARRASRLPAMVALKEG